MRKCRARYELTLRPSDVAIDGDGCLFVADTNNHRIRKVDPNGKVSTVAGSGTKGFQDGASADAQFKRPSGVAIDGDGCLFVADKGNNRIRKLKKLKSKEGTTFDYSFLLL